MNNRPIADWDPRGEDVLRDQRDAYDAMRERCPVAYSDFLNWSLFRHKDVTGVLADPVTYSSASGRLAVPNGIDPPRHGLYRRALAPYFSLERMAAFEPRCRRIAADLAQQLLANGEAEFVSEFAEPYTLLAACEFLGWPLESWKYLRGWSHGNQEAAFSQNREAGAVLAREFTEFVSEQIRLRRETQAHQGDDITTQLMATQIEGRPLSDDEIVSALRNWIAGHGTVAAALGILAVYLATHADDQQRLRTDPTLLPAAIDEILRTDGPLVANRRTTTRDVEIGGRQIPRGSRLTLIWIAANRDEHVFDEPDAVQFDRDPRENLLFGAGIHDCLGAPLARLEMRVALEEILARMAALDLASSRAPERSFYPGNGLVQAPMIFR